jgi:hypothetical protein
MENSSHGTRLSLRVNVIVDFSWRDCSQGVFQAGSLLGRPNLVQTLPTDAAGEVCMKLSRVELAGAATLLPGLVIRATTGELPRSWAASP